MKNYKNKTNLIFFIPEFVRGGAANSILSLCKNLNKKKFSIYIISLGKNEYKKELLKFCKIVEIKRKKTIFAQTEIKKLLKEITKFYKKNILISNFFYANVILALCQQKTQNLKFIFTERTTLTELSTFFNIKDFIKKKIIKFLVRFTYNKADLIITNSNKVSKDLNKFIGVKSTFVYPGTIKRKKIKKNKKKITKYKKIVWVGRLAKEKGLEILIKSIKSLKKDTFKLDIYGDGPLKNDLKKIILKNNLEENVFIKGFSNNVSQILFKYDLLLNTSYFEGFPNVVVEALANSVPVIASRSGGGVNEIIGNGKFGDLFENKNHLDLRKKILNFINFPKNLNSRAKKAKEHLRKFDERVSAKKYERIFNNLKFN